MPLALPVRTEVSHRGKHRHHQQQCQRYHSSPLQSPRRCSRVGDTLDVLSTGDLDFAVTGVAEIVLCGDVRTANRTLSGAGMIDTSALSAQHASALVSGAGDILVWAIDTLEATVTGIGDIKYHGSPSVARVITGAGSIRSTGDD